MALTWITENAGFQEGAVNIGVVRLSGADVLVVDAGLDDDRSRKVARDLEAEALTPRLLFITHGNADHFGGAGLLRRRGVKTVAAPPLEATYIRHPVLEPASLNGWAAPPPELLTKFLLAPALQVDLEVLPGPWRPPGAESLDLEVLALPGHSFGQGGLRVGEVIFCGDAVFPEETWRKHPFVYYADVPQALATLEILERLAPRALVAGHTADLENPLRLLQTNRSFLERLTSLVESLLPAPAAELTGALDPFRVGLATDDILAEAAESLGVTLSDAPDFYLARSTVQAHLSRLAHEGRARPVVEENRLLWRLP